MEISFQGLKVIVTGAGQGIGRELVKTLANASKAPSEIFAISRTSSHLDSLSKELNDAKSKVTFIQVDLSDWEATEKAFQSLPPVNCLVNNAAVAILEPFFSIKKESIDKTFDLNVRSIIQVSQYVAAKMVDNKIKGTIVNISSQAAQAALKDHTAYCASKAAVDQLTKMMALELGPHGIRTNSVNPTVVMTAMGRLGWTDPIKQNTMISKIPLGRFAEVHEVVEAIIYLLSDKSSMINGVTVPIDGGFLAC